MKKILILFCLYFVTILGYSQDLVSGGLNSWLFHTPDDGRTTLYLAPMINGNWAWGSQTQFLNNGDVLFNGKVGIGTLAPYGKLHIFSQNSPTHYYDGELHIGGFIGNTNDVTMIIGTHYTNKTAFLQGWRAGSGSTPILIQPQGGNVGIGTTNPQYKLTVEGTIAAREVKVTLEAWSDFVFHPTYKLRSLGEVEQFIKTNSHLPEIPTEADVKQNGIGLGEINAKLLQKIEELTLYMIEQNKKMDQQQKIIEKQNLRIEKLEQRNDK